jgi:hypothetical protein
VARKPKPEHPELPFDALVAIPNEALDEPDDAAESTGRKMGRPRKWATEAERKRAYRERLAADIAEPERLRRELRPESRGGEVQGLLDVAPGVSATRPARKPAANRNRNKSKKRRGRN